MNYSVIRRIVEEEVLKHLSRARPNVRVRRPVVAEHQVAAAWKRGARLLEVTPGALVTPAAAERARRLGVEIREVMIHAETSPDFARLVEEVLAAVLSEFADRPRAAARRPPTRRLLTAADVEAARWHGTVIEVGPRTRVTPLARDRAEKLGLKIKVAE